jgi:hypothetical protein
MRQQRAPGPGSRTAGGAGGDFCNDSRARGQNFAKCGERERGPEILVRGT